MKKKVIIIISSIIVLAIIVCLIVVLTTSKKGKLTALEEATLKKETQISMLYFDRIDSDNNGIDNYIAFALQYSFNEENTKELSVKDIEKIVSQFFNISLNTEELKENGISPLLVENSITYDYEKEVYVINKEELSQQDIANIDIPIYMYESAKKKKDKYIVTYKKYIISNPYAVLNYYEQKEVNEDGTISTKEYDTTEILNYLTAKGHVNSIKKAVNKDMIEEVSGYEKDIKVTYVMKDDKLLIDNIS